MKLIEQPGRNLKKDYTSQTNKREREREREREGGRDFLFGHMDRHIDITCFFFFFFDKSIHINMFVHLKRQ